METKSQVHNPDAAIFEMGQQFDAIYRQWDALPDGAPEIKVISAKSVELAHRVLLSEFDTNAGLAQKMRVVEIAALEVDSNHIIGETGSDFIRLIYRLDRERIAAAKLQV